MQIQLDLFEEEKTEVECLKEYIRCIKESSDKVRRSMFARHAELAKKYTELHERMDIIERNICQKETKNLFQL